MSSDVFDTSSIIAQDAAGTAGGAEGEGTDTTTPPVDAAPPVPPTPEVPAPESKPAEGEGTTSTPETPETPPQGEPASEPTFESRVQKLGGEPFVEKAVAFYEALNSADFDPNKFLENLYESSNTRYSQVVSAIAKAHSDELAKFLFGAESTEAVKTALSGAALPNEANKIAEAFGMTQDDFELLPKGTQDLLKGQYDKQIEAQQAVAQQQQLAAEQAQEKQIADWTVNCNSEVAKACEQLKVADETTRSRVQSLVWGAVGTDKDVAKIFSDIMTHLNNGEVSLAQNLTQKFNTHLSTIAAREAAPFIELAQLRNEVETLRRQIAGGRVEPPISQGSQGEARVETPATPFGGKPSALFNSDDISKEFANLKR